MSAGVGDKADDRLDAKIDFVGQSIDRRDLFYFLMYMILENVPKNREQLDVYRTEQDAITIRLTSLWSRASPRPGTHLPYIMDRGDMISFLADLPKYVLRKNPIRGDECSYQRERRLDSSWVVSKENTVRCTFGDGIEHKPYRLISLCKVKPLRCQLW